MAPASAIGVPVAPSVNSNVPPDETVTVPPETIVNPTAVPPLNTVTLPPLDTVVALAVPPASTTWEPVKTVAPLASRNRAAARPRSARRHRCRGR